MHSGCPGCWQDSRVGVDETLAFVIWSVLEGPQVPLEDLLTIDDVASRRFPAKPEHLGARTREKQSPKGGICEE